MLQVKWPVIDTIHPYHNKFVKGVKIKATGGSNLNDGPDLFGSRNTHCCNMETSDKGHND